MQRVHALWHRLYTTQQQPRRAMVRPKARVKQAAAGGKKRKQRDEFFEEEDQDEFFVQSGDEKGGGSEDESEPEAEETAEEKRLRLGALQGVWGRGAASLPCHMPPRLERRRRRRRGCLLPANLRTLAPARPQPSCTWTRSRR